MKLKRWIVAVLAAGLVLAATWSVAAAEVEESQEKVAQEKVVVDTKTDNAAVVEKTEAKTESATKVKAEATAVTPAKKQQVSSVDLATQMRENRMLEGLLALNLTDEQLDAVIAGLSAFKTDKKAYEAKLATLLTNEKQAILAKDKAKLQQVRMAIAQAQQEFTVGAAAKLARLQNAMQSPGQALKQRMMQSQKSRQIRGKQVQVIQSKAAAFNQLLSLGAILQSNEKIESLVALLQLVKENN